ncbi:protein ALP1-like [Centruroides sculpturatus]|uniref:protein ALP1-like n=1 Tax=Centruroides sculpturatus TaxID=218467 RepID=UPI000C6E4F33|nr:protein ALP1-like [Centruroides sculpturatus]
MKENYIKLNWMKHKVRRLRRRSAILALSILPFQHPVYESKHSIPSHHFKFSEKSYTCLCYLLRDSIENGEYQTIGVKRIVENALNVLTSSGDNHLELENPEELLVYFCRLVVENLGQKFIQFPKNGESFDNILKGFEEFGFPQCFGVVGIRRFPTNVEDCNNFTLFAVCDYANRFFHIEINSNSNRTNEQIYDSSNLNDILAQENVSNIIKDRDVIVSPCLIADNSFPLKGNLITPYKTSNLNEQQELFNQKLNVIQDIMKKTFAKLKSRFVCLSSDGIDEMLIHTCCILHNICEILGDTTEDYWLLENEYDEWDEVSNTESPEALITRESFLQLLCN